MSGSDQACDQAMDLDSSASVDTGKTAFDWMSLRLFVSVFIAFCGAGMLGLPFAFKEAGLFEGLVILSSICAASVWAMLLLVDVRYYLAQQSRDGPSTFVSFADVGHAAAGRAGRLVVEIVLSVAHVGFCGAYLIFISKTLATMTPHLSKLLSESSFWLCLVAPVMIPLMMLSFEKLHLTSSLADVSTLCAYGIVYYVDFERISSHEMFNGKGVTLSHLRGLPLFASVAMYCYEGAGLVLSLEHASYSGEGMHERRRKFPSMFIFSIVLITLCYTAFGVAGYAAFGEEVRPVISLNLGDGIFATLIKVALSVALFFTFPVVMHPIVQIVETRSSLSFMTVRCGLVAITVLLVLLVPNFASLMELIGGSACALISLILPAFFHYTILGPVVSPWKRRADLILIVLGCALGITCTVVAFGAQVNHYHHHSQGGGENEVPRLRLSDLP